jgi:hypothetical protein
MTGQVELRMRDYLHRQVKSALHAASDAVRIVTEIGLWVRTQEHLISLCTTENCADCATRESLLKSLVALLPSLERRADAGEEDSDARHSSDPTGRRPGAVIPDP